MSDLLEFSPPGQVTFPLAGAKARFYDAGTTNLRTVYADEAETIPHPSPLVADGSGRFAQAFVSGGAVKVVVTQADDSTGYTLDPCTKTGATGASAASVSFAPSTGLPEANVQDAIDALSNRTLAASQLAGRNRIINGQGRINQRVYVSGTNTVGANQYTLDRWRVVVSGQNLTFTGSDAGRTMTAPAGGVEQVIEGADIEGGTYVLNWTGTASATVNGTSRAKGETFTLTANTNATVRFTSGTFTDVQLELGTIPTPFERLPLADELARCQRYFEVIQGDGVVATGQAWSATAAYAAIPYKVEKRATPVITLPALGVVSGTATFLNASGVRVSTGSLSVTSANVSQVVVAITGTSGLVAGNASNFFADAADIFISAEL